MPKLNVEIPAVTGERDLDFVLANLRDVAALDALWGRTIKEVPRWLEEQLMGGVLRDECAELMTELDLVVDYDKDNGGFVWGPTGFDKKRSPGLWLLMPEGLDWLLRHRDDGPQIYLWVYKGPELARWVKRAEQQRARLTHEGFRVLAFPEEEEPLGGRTLLSRSLDDLLKPESLARRDLRATVAARIEDVTRRAMKFVRGAGAPRLGRKKRG